MSAEEENVKDSFTEEDLKKLEDCEITIKTHKKGHLALGRALLTIRNGRLYKIKGFKTFEAFCQEQCGFTRQWAYRLMKMLNSPESDLSTQVDKTACLKTDGISGDFKKLDPDSQEDFKADLENGDDPSDAMNDAQKKKEKKPKVKVELSDSLKFSKLMKRFCDALRKFDVPEDKMYDKLEPVREWLKEYEERLKKIDLQQELELEFEKAA